MKADIIRILKDKHNITTENGKLAIYLSGEYENLENIAKNTHETEVLIFKQAIALGWDCPRAQVLVLFRDWQSLTFFHSDRRAHYAYARAGQRTL